jgi:biopolymer transport protein ExbB/TolQ
MKITIDIFLVVQFVTAVVSVLGSYYLLREKILNLKSQIELLKQSMGNKSDRIEKLEKAVEQLADNKAILLELKVEFKNLIHKVEKIEDFSFKKVN